METQHTPGPWHTGTMPDTARSIYAAEGRMRCEEKGTCLYPIAWTVDFDGEAEANARLIAAAPELLTACRVAYAILREKQIAEGVTVRLQEIIAKAERE